MSNKITIDSGGGNLEISGSNVGGKGNIVSGSSTTQLNNQSDLKPLLAELSKAVKEMADSLSDQEKQRVERSLAILQQEAENPTPDKKWWSISVEGLSSAAKKVGEIGKPVLDLVARIVPILSQLSI